MVTIIERYEGRFDKEIAELIVEIQSKEFSIPITLSDQPDLQQIASFYQRAAGNFWIARDGQKVVGTVGLLDIGNNQAALRKMFVAKEYRGKEFGVAQALLQKLLEWARQNELVSVYLGTTSAFIAAQRFYEKNRFSKISKDTLPKSFPIMAVDSVFYEKRLDASTS